MKTLVRLLVAGGLLMAIAGAEPTSLKLISGSVIKGEVTPPTPDATEVVVGTEFGVVRVPVDKISAESRKTLGLGQPATSGHYEAKIAQLEARVRELEAENARLRRAAASGTSGGTITPAPATRSLPLVTEPAKGGSSSASGLSYSRSSTGKRHNSRCRYFGSGSPCGPSDGVACKICGG